MAERSAKNGKVVCVNVDLLPEILRINVDLSAPKPTRENIMAYAFNTSKYTTLITPKRHVGRFIDLLPSERHLCLGLVDSIQSAVRARNGSARFDVHFDSDYNASQKHYSIILHQIRRP